MIKSQVLSGGRMKAGGVKFADTPRRPRSTRGDPRARDQRPDAPRGAGRPQGARSSRSTTPGSSGTRPQAAGDDVLAVGGIDIEQVAAEQPETVGRRHLSNILPLSDFQAKEAIAATGVSGTAAQRGRRRSSPASRRSSRLRHDARRDQPAGRARRRQLRRTRRAHGDGERGPRRATRLCSPSSGRRARRPGRRVSPPPFELAGEEVDATDHRGVAGQRDRVRRQPRAGDRRRRRIADAVRRGPRARRAAGQLLRDRRQPVGRQGLRAGQAGAREGGRGARSR